VAQVPTADAEQESSLNIEFRFPAHVSAQRLAGLRHAQVDRQVETSGIWLVYNPLRPKRMSIFDENGHPTENLFDRLEAGEKLEGYAALAVLAGSFSNATHGNYSSRTDG
jgi:hypothetical protein